MKYQELRLGNWVKYLDNPVKMNLELFEQNITFVPITPEILISVGFEQSNINDKDTYQLNVEAEHRRYYLILVGLNYLFGIAQDMPAYGGRSTWSTEYCILNKEVNFVHRLQNIYFMLRGQELDIKL
jgi:hypothetical protein